MFYYIFPLKKQEYTNWKVHYYQQNSMVYAFKKLLLKAVQRARGEKSLLVFIAMLSLKLAYIVL